MTDLQLAILSLFALVVICIVAYVLERTISTINKDVNKDE